MSVSYIETMLVDMVVCTSTSVTVHHNSSASRYRSICSCGTRSAPWCGWPWDGCLICVTGGRLSVLSREQMHG